MLSRLVAGMLERIWLRLEDQLETFIDRLKQVGLGLAVIRTSFWFWGTGAIFLLLSIFFKLSPLNAYIFASLVTGLLSLAVGILLTLVGVRLMRRR